MPLVFTPSTTKFDSSPFIGMRGAFVLVGTLTFSGSYATGGDTFTAGKTLEDFAKRIGAGKVLAALADIRGATPEWDATNKKLKLYIGTPAELGAGAYAAVFTATPAPAAFLCI